MGTGDGLGADVGTGLVGDISSVGVGWVAVGASDGLKADVGTGAVADNFSAGATVGLTRVPAWATVVAGEGLSE